MIKSIKAFLIPFSLLFSLTTNSCSIAKREIALITDAGDIDDGSFNQEAWEACKEYSDNHNKTLDFYRPFNDSEFALTCAIKQAAAKGAKIIVLPGFKFSSVAERVQHNYPDIHFLLLDSVTNEVCDNLCCVTYQAEYSGFLAGYSVAMDLMEEDLKTNGKFRDTYGYGFMGGMATDSVIPFGFGFIQGLCVATAIECDANNLSNDRFPQLNINYDYAGVFVQDDNATAKIKGWYSNEQRDIKVIFCCGGKLYQSVAEGAQYYNKRNHLYDDWSDKAPRESARWIGVDSDQYKGLKYDNDKKTIYTSALKGLRSVINDALDYHYNNNWSSIGGPAKTRQEDEKFKDLNQWCLGMNTKFGDTAVEYKSYVGLPTECNEKKILRNFYNFTSNQYDILVNELCSLKYEVYGGDGSDCIYDKGEIKPGYPTGMPEWKLKDKGISFRDKYLKSYPKIEINVI